MAERSPIIFWLLLAATVSVDVVAIFWVAGPRQSEASFTLFFALAAAHISIAGISTAFARTRSWGRWCAPFAIAVVAALITYAIMPYVRLSFDIGILVTWVVIFELHALPVVGVLLFVQQYRSTARRWQFSLWHMLVIMTVAAVIVISVQSTELAPTDWYHVAAMISSSVLVTASAALAYGAVGHWLLRLGALFGVALITGWGLNSTDLIWEWRAFTLAQAVVLWLWLQWGGLIDSNEIDDHVERATAPIRQSSE